MLQDCVCSIAPSHFFPPKSGLGFVQVRTLFLIPPPQGLLQFPKSLQSDRPPSTGHGASLHLLVITFGPEHSLPRGPGVGLLHLRILPCNPSPHVLEHTLHPDQLEYPPGMDCIFIK